MAEEEPRPPSKTGHFAEAMDVEFVRVSDAAPGRWLVQIVKAGATLNGWAFPAETLRAGAGAFEGRPIQAYDLGAPGSPYFDHLPIKVQRAISGGLLRATVGVIRKAWFDEERQAVMGEVVIWSDWLRRLLDQLSKAMNGPVRTFGVSLNAVVAYMQKGALKVAQAIHEVSSVEVVTRPAAGGEFVQALASIAIEETKEGSYNMGKENEVKNEETVHEVGEVELSERIHEVEEIAKRAAERAATLEAKLAERLRMSSIREAVESIGKDLPKAMRGAIIDALRASVPADADEDAIREAAKARVDELAAAVKPKSGKVEVVQESADKLRGATLAMFGVAEDQEADGIAPFRSLRQAYIEVTGDTGMEMDLSRQSTILPDTWATILGEAMYRRLIREYNAVDFGEGALIATYEPVSDFKTHHLSALGGFGDLSTIAVDRSYPVVSALPPEETATLSVSKKGVILKVAWETIVNDDRGAVERAVRKLGRAARRTFAKAVYGILTSNANIYDGNPLFDSSHGNVTADAWSYTAQLAARVAMLAHQEPGSDEPMGIDIKEGGLLVIPAGLWSTVFETLTAKGKPGTTDNSGNALCGWFGANQERVVTNPFATDANDWYNVANPKQYEGIVAGFLNGQRVPEMRVQNDPTAFSTWNNDVIEYKVKHVWGLTVADYRPFYAGIVA